MNKMIRLLLLLSTSSLAATTVTAQASNDDSSEIILAKVAALEPDLSGMSQDLWSWAEIGFKETRSSQRLEQALRDAGFSIETGVAGMPTAFIATAGSGGPVIALLAEFDALPGLANAAIPTNRSIEGQTAGHACGHNLLGSASVVAAIAIKQWLEESGTKGTVRLYGSPAEEGGFSKVYMVRDGFFDDVDITLTWHPGDKNSATPGRSLAMISGKFTFNGVASHASVAPERGRSALDGVEVMNTAVNYLREHVPQGTRIHYVITDGGNQPNIVPARAQSFFFVRSPSAGGVKDVWDRVVKAGEGAAMATGTSMSVEVISGAYNTLPNTTLNALIHSNLTRVGGYHYTSEEADFAKRIVTTYEGRKGDVGDPMKIEPLGPVRQGSASSDVGDVSWAVPTGSLSTATWVKGTSPHSWQAAATSGVSIGEKGALVAAKTMALTAADLYRDKKLIDAVKREFAESRGSDFNYVPLLGDRKPALDYNEK